MTAQYTKRDGIREYNLTMGVIQMQMNSSRAVADDACTRTIRRQHIISQTSSLNQSQTSSPLSKKRRLQLSPPTTEANDISQSLSSTPTQTPLSPSTNCRRCSSPSRLISVENKQRPPRHPDSPIPTSSSLLCHTMPQFCPRHDIIDDYTNEKYPKELLARIKKKNSYTKMVDNEQRDEKEDDAHRSVASNDTFCLSTEDEKVLQRIPAKIEEESSNVKVSEVIEQKKDSILDFFKRLPSTLIKRRREEKDSNVNDVSVSCEVGLVSPISEDEILDEKQQHKVVSNETFRLLLSRSQEEEAFDGVSDSLHLKSESSESELQKKVFPQTFEYLDIWP